MAVPQANRYPSMNTTINNEIMVIAPAKIGRRLIEFSLEKLSHIAIADVGINITIMIVIGSWFLCSYLLGEE